MNINRHNYEAYFLLYIDNELSATEKNLVDAFITENPDLGEELVMLQQSILKMDTVAFDQKEILLKPQPANEITEEKLLLLLDGELNDTEKNNVLALINTDTAVKEEWELLQQTKFSAADNIVFESKELLYRKESKVVALPWWRMAAAAVLIGAGLWGASKYFTATEVKSNTPVVETVQGNAIEKKLPAASQRSSVVSAEKNDIDKSTVDITVQPSKPYTRKTGAIDKSLVKQRVSSQKTGNTYAGNDPKESLPENNALKEINERESNKKIYVSVSPETNITKPESNSITPSSLQNNFAVNASLSNAETQPVAYQSFDDDDEDKPKRTKLGGLFKRVKRVLERKAKIKTGSDDEVRIANMSFAMH